MNKGIVLKKNSEIQYTLYAILKEDESRLIRAKQLRKESIEGYPFKPVNIFLIGESKNITPKHLKECCAVLPAHTKMENGKKVAYGALPAEINFKQALKALDNPEYAVIVKTIIVTKDTIDDIPNRDSKLFKIS